MLSEENKQARRGKLTASGISALMGVKEKGGENISDWSKGAQTYILEKVSELLSFESHEIYSKEMEWGNLHEPYAKSHFHRLTGIEIIDSEFVLMPGFEAVAGATPDSLFSDGTAGIEIKCPYTLVNHTKYMLFKSANDLKSEKPEYYWQIVMNMICCKVDKWFFLSYHPYFNKDKQLFCLEINKVQSDFDLLTLRIDQAVKTINKIFLEI